MITKINLDVVAQDDEERKIEEYLNILHESKEVQNFLTKMKQEAENQQVYQYRARIKNPKSAIRTHRINKKTLNEVRDYIGVSFITNKKDEIFPIINILKNEITNGDYVDFTEEESIYSPLVYQKWVPPMGYNILAKEPLIPHQMDVPIEIRVCSKAGYISEQSAYYSVQKNDTITMPIERKNQLRNLVQHITYKLAVINVENLSEEERIKQIEELNTLIQNNKDFLKENNDLCEDAILDFGRLVYKCEHNTQISEDEKNLSVEQIEGLDDKLKNIFSTLIDFNGNDFINNVCAAVNDMRKIDYKEIKK